MASKLLQSAISAALSEKIDRAAYGRNLLSVGGSIPTRQQSDSGRPVDYANLMRIEQLKSGAEVEKAKITAEAAKVVAEQRRKQEQESDTASLYKELLSIQSREKVASTEERNKFANKVLAHSFANETENLKEAHRENLTALKYALGAEERKRLAEKDEILNSLNVARTNQILNEKDIIKYKNNLKILDEQRQLEADIRKDTLKTNQRLKEEAMKDIYRNKVAEVKAILNPPKETATEAFDRTVKTGGFVSVKDIATFWAKRGNTGKKLETLTELSAAQLGVKVAKPSWLRSVLSSSSKQQVYQQWLNTPIPLPDMENSANILKKVRKAGSRQKAEQKAYQKEKMYIMSGATPEQIGNDIATIRRAIEHVYPNEPSIYETLKLNDKEAQAALAAAKPSATAAYANVSDNIAQLYNMLIGDNTEQANEAIEQLQKLRKATDDILNIEASSFEQKKKKEELRKLLGVQ
jgi:hypothetical protein